MKQMITWLLLMILLIGILPVASYATEIDTDIIYFDNGGYMTVEIVTTDVRISGSKTGAKQYTYYDSDGISQWKAVLTGKFTYTGSSATCTSSSVDVTIYDSSWYVILKYASKSGNKATASVTMGDNPTGITITKVPVSLTLQCDPNGNLS